MSKPLPKKVHQMLGFLNRNSVGVTDIGRRPADGAWIINLDDDEYRIMVYGVDYSVSRVVNDDKGGQTAQFSRIMRKHADVLDKLRQYAYPGV